MVYAGGDWAKSTAQKDIIQLPAMQLPREHVGTHSEHALRRYAAGNARSTMKFARAIRHIEKRRQRDIHRASPDPNSTSQRYSTTSRARRSQACQTRLRGRPTRTSVRRRAVPHRSTILLCSGRPPQVLELARKLADRRSWSLNKRLALIISGAFVVGPHGVSGRVS